MLTALIVAYLQRVESNNHPFQIYFGVGRGAALRCVAEDGSLEVLKDIDELLMFVERMGKGERNCTLLETR